ncbi:MAG: OmpA family protein [bacterium]
MKVLKIIFFVISTTLLSGCYNGVVYQTDAEIYSPQAQISLLNKRLVAYDVRILQDKDSLVLVLPSKELFNSSEELFGSNSANFTQEAYKVLDLILELASYYEKSVISVKGFAGVNCADALSLTIAAERAHKVVQYLWKSGIDSSLMYADSSNAISSLTDCVVISFRKLN